MSQNQWDILCHKCIPPAKDPHKEAVPAKVLFRGAATEVHNLVQKSSDAFFRLPSLAPEFLASVPLIHGMNQNHYSN